MVAAVWACLLWPVSAWPQQSSSRARLARQQSFEKVIPPGNYSGITWIGGDRYAVVSDKSATDGFFIFRIDIDTVRGRIRRVEDLGFRSSGLPNRDAEGIAWIPDRQTVMVVGEADSRIVEYNLDGQPTGWSFQLPTASTSQGYESLAYDAGTHMLWTMTEASCPSTDGISLRKTIEAPPGTVWGAAIHLDDSLCTPIPYLYTPDPPRKKPVRGEPYVHGVSELLALANGSLLVLEREVWAARNGLRAAVWCKLYRAFPARQSADVPTQKQLVASWKTSLPSIPPRLANYEGMTLGPRLADGSQTVILIADSQNRYRHLLRDWFKVVVLRP